MYNMYIRDSIYNTLFWRRLPLALTSFWTGQIAKEYRTHTVNSIMKSVHFLVNFPRASWYDTRRVTVCLLPHSLVIGEDCLYTRTMYLVERIRILCILSMKHDRIRRWEYTWIFSFANAVDWAQSTQRSPRGLLTRVKWRKTLTPIEEPLHGTCIRILDVQSVLNLVVYWMRDEASVFLQRPLALLGYPHTVPMDKTK